MATMTQVRERPQARSQRPGGENGVYNRQDRRDRRRPDGQRHRACRALAGMDVLLNDISADRINAGLATINGNLTRQVSRKLIAEEDRAGGARAHPAGRHARQARRLRSRDRVRDREGRRQAQDLRRPLPAPEAGRDHRHQHLVDLDHAACRLDRPAGALHRHPLHESGAGDGAGRADPRHRDRRTRRSRRAASSSRSSARRSRSRRISRPSSSTASCCR